MRSATSARLVAVAAVVGSAALVSGCFTTTQTITTRHNYTTTAPATKRPTVTVIKTLHNVAAGETAILLRAQKVSGVDRQIKIVFKAGKPSVSHEHLGSYGYAPEHGLYLTFKMHIVNKGDVAVFIQPTDFSVDVGGSETHVTSYEYAAPYSGEPTQLDSVNLLAGESVSKPLTYDVDSDHGTLTYAPEGKPAIRWHY